MIIMPVPKDVREFKPKFIGPFSKREFIGVFVAAIFAVITFALTSSIAQQITLNQRVGVIFIPAAIPLSCGFIDIQGMPIWVYAENMIIQNFLAPRHRGYRTNNNFAEYAKRNRITMEYLDEDVAVTKAQKRKKKKEYEKNLKEFVESHPEYESFS